MKDGILKDEFKYQLPDQDYYTATNTVRPNREITLDYSYHVFG